MTGENAFSCGMLGDLDTNYQALKIYRKEIGFLSLLLLKKISNYLIMIVVPKKQTKRKQPKNLVRTLVVL